MSSNPWDCDSASDQELTVTDHTSDGEGCAGENAWDVDSDDAASEHTVLHVTQPDIQDDPDDTRPEPPAKRIKREYEMFPSISWYTSLIERAASFYRAVLPESQTQPMLHEDFCSGTLGLLFPWQVELTFIVHAGSRAL